MLRSEIAAFATHTERTKLRVRSSTIFPLVFQLPVDTATLSCCMQAASLLVSASSMTELCAIVAERYAKYKRSIPPSIDQRGFKVLSWNATSLPVKDPNHWKITKLQRAARDHIICLQETKLCHTGLHHLQILFPQCLVLGSPAVTAKEGPSGGVAIVIPTHLYGAQCTWTDYVPGYAGCVELQLLHTPFRIVSMYLRPGQETKILASVTKALHSPQAYHGTTLVAGDANAVRDTIHFSDFLDKLELQDLCTLAGTPLQTFTHANGQSALDVFALSAKLVDISGWTSQVTIRERPDEHHGHKFLYLNCRPPTGQRNARCNKYSRLPDRQFCSKQHSCRVLPALLAQHLNADDSPVDALLAMNAFFQAFAITFPTTHTLSAAFRLRKAKQANNSSVLVPAEVVLDAVSKTRIELDLQAFPRTSKGLVRIPRRLRDELLRALNDYDSLQRNLDDATSYRKALLGIPPSLKHWERLRALSPKDMGMLCQLVDQEGRKHTEPAALAEVVLQGREFWMTAPVTISPEQMTHHCRYVPDAQCSDAPDFPGPSNFFSALVCCPNTSPGLDGIPYSAYKAAPETSAHVLHKVFKSICTQDCILNPKQLLVWIPKAQAGIKPENWRPLSMPLVYDRILDKVVFKRAFHWFSQVLHPSQSLVDVIKEAQYNFCEAQRLLRSHANKLAAVLLIDLSKAFERVNLPWIKFLLARYQAPRWLQAYFSWTFSERTTVTKISGQLVSTFKPLVGLDMGRACSVLLFCLSIDPMFWQLHNCQLSVQRAYMDDTTLASPGIAWVQQAQSAFLEFDPIGIVVDGHTCCRFLSSCGSQLGQFSSWQQAAIYALQTSHTTFDVQGLEGTFSREALRSLCQEQMTQDGLTLLARLCALKCNCKAKTTLIPSVQLTLQQVADLDACPFGAKIIKSLDITLGLPIASSHSNVMPLTQEGLAVKPGRHKHSSLLATALARALVKLTLRAARICLTHTSGPKRALFWTTFCQSTLYYATSVFALSSNFVRKLQRLQQKVLLGVRTWLPMKHIASIFQAFKIGPCAHVQVSCQKANLAAVLRLYGPQELFTSNSQTSMVKQARQSLQSFSRLAVQQCNDAVNALVNTKAAKHTKHYKKIVSKFLTSFHTTLKEEGKRLAVQHVRKLALKSAFLQFSLSSCDRLVAHLTNVPTKFLSPVDRFYFLRWLTCAEVDADYYEKLQGLSAEGTCSCGSIRPSRMKPFWRASAALCTECFHRHLPSPAPWRQFVQSSMIPPDMQHIHSLVPPMHKQVYYPVIAEEHVTHQIVACPFCQMGPASTTHWLHFCPIVGLTLSAILNEVYDITLFTNPDTPANTLTTLVVAVAKLRRRLLALGSLSADANKLTLPTMQANAQHWFHPQNCKIANNQLSSLRAALMQIGALRTDLAVAACPFPGFNTSCPAINCALLHTSPPSLLAALPQANILKGCPIPVLSQDVSEGTLLAVLHPHHPLFTAISNNRPVNEPCCLVHISEVECACGATHAHLIASKHALAGAQLICEDKQTRTGTQYLLVQSDGSYLRSKDSTAGGLGVIVWKCTVGQPPVALAFSSIPARQSTDSMHSEALAFQAAVHLALEHLPSTATRTGEPPTVVFQMDNLPLVQHFNKTAKCSHLAAARIMARSALLLYCHVHNAIVEYIPRESNVFADYAAGLASAHLQENTRDTVDLFEPNLALPLFGCPAPNHTIPRSGALQLTEKPSALRSEVANFLANFPFKSLAHKLAAQNYATLTSSGTGAGLQVNYRCAQGQRVYASQPSGQALPKEVRLFFFGKDHFEIDMVAAQLHLLVSVATGRSMIGLLTIAEFRQQLTRDLSRLNNTNTTTAFIKQFLNIAINVTYDKAVQYLQKQFLFVPDYMFELLHSLVQHKTDAINFATSLGFEASNCNDKNRVYFALEYLEQTFMRTFLQHLCIHADIASIVFIHDGLYIQPCPDEITLRSAIAEASNQLGIHEPSLRVVKLLPQWCSMFQHMPRAVPVQQHVDKPCVHEAKRRKYAHTFTFGPPNKRKEANLTTVEQHGTLLNYFKKKRLLA